MDTTVTDIQDTTLDPDTTEARGMLRLNPRLNPRLIPKLIPFSGHADAATITPVLTMDTLDHPTDTDITDVDITGKGLKKPFKIDSPDFLKFAQKLQLIFGIKFNLF